MLIPSFSPFSEPLTTVFTFQAVPLPSETFKFKGRQAIRPAPKRSRPVADVEDGTADSKKKRRLRLHLITSRLSRPFSEPATNIVDPGSSRIAVWAKQRHLTPQVLRKAAIMNRVRRRTIDRKDSGISISEDERREARAAVMEGVKVEQAVVAGLGPNAIALLQDERNSWQHNSSPLGLSNYDALDEEDDYYESYHEEDEDEDGGPLSLWPNARAHDGLEEEPQKEYYTDWNIRVADQEEEDALAVHALPSELLVDKRPPSPPEGRMIELLKEQERQQEILSGFLHFS